CVSRAGSKDFERNHPFAFGRALIECIHGYELRTGTFDSEKIRPCGIDPQCHAHAPGAHATDKAADTEIEPAMRTADNLERDQLSQLRRNAADGAAEERSPPRIVDRSEMNLGQQRQTLAGRRQRLQIMHAFPDRRRVELKHGFFDLPFGYLRRMSPFWI